MNATKSTILTFAAALLAADMATAAPNVTINSVVQRWPWNNKVDINYTVFDGQNISSGSYMRLEFIASVNGTDYTIDGGSLGASASDGTYTVTWNPPSGIKATGCTMVAKLYSASVPSGNDYMILNLADGSVIYEGAYADQTISDARYNVDEFKTTKMVFRKVPKGSYQIGYSQTARGNPGSMNTHDGNASPSEPLVTDKDYYVGIFNVTEAQFDKVYNGTTSSSKVPKGNVSWVDLRTDIAPTSAIPAVATSGTGTFLQRLCYLASNEFAFDLPTEAMFEIAHRAGATTKYSWGDTFNSDYCVNNESSKQVVGTKLANNWGLFDMSGNVLDMCLDDCTQHWYNNIRDVFIPQCGLRQKIAGDRTDDELMTYIRSHGGSWYADGSNNYDYWASWRGRLAKTQKGNIIGFRVAYVVK